MGLHFPVVSGAIGTHIHVNLFHAEIVLFRNTDCLFQGIEFRSEQIGLDWIFRETLHEQRNQRLIIQRICCNTTRKVTYVLHV